MMNGNYYEIHDYDWDFYDEYNDIGYEDWGYGDIDEYDEYGW